MSSTRRSSVALAVLISALALTGCVPPPKSSVQQADELDASSTLLVGRIELVPALTPAEYELESFTYADYENVASLLTAYTFRPLSAELSTSDYKGRIDAPLGEFFFVKTSSEPFYVRGATIFVSSGRPVADRILLPGGFRVPVTSGSRAAYIGTIRYHRNEFFEITKVELIDEFEAARAAARQRFQQDIALTRALIQPASEN